VGEGRKESDLKLFWKWFKRERAERITHGVMDMAIGQLWSYTYKGSALKFWQN